MRGLRNSARSLASSWATVIAAVAFAMLGFGAASDAEAGWGHRSNHGLGYGQGYGRVVYHQSYNQVRHYAPRVQYRQPVQRVVYHQPQSSYYQPKASYHYAKASYHQPRHYAPRYVSNHGHGRHCNRG